MRRHRVPRVDGRDRVTVQIARGSRTGWRDGRLQFRIESKAESEVLLGVLWGIGARLVELDTDEEYGPKFVSDCLVLPDGAAFWLDSPDVSPKMADRIVATIVDGLEAGGIDGRLSGAGKGLERASGPQVALAAVPGHPPARDAFAILPWDEVERAIDWTLDDPTAHIVVESGAVYLDLPHLAVRGYVTYLHRRGRSCHVLAESAADRRECSIGHTAEEHRIHECPHLGLAWSGLAVQSDIDAAFETLIERARLIGPWAATVHVTVHPEAHDVFFVNPPWHNDPSGRDATVALADHVLDAYPWQRLRPSQAGHLPKPLHRLVSYDPASGELRMGRLDHWLREPATVRRSEFARAMRSMLGRAVITRDLAWDGMQQLPTSWPRPTGELLIEAPAVDLDTVPVDGYERTHPSLGVGPLELLSLRRGGYFHDVVEISLPLRHWLEGLARVAYIDDEPIRRIVDALADADVGQRHTLNHLSALHSWLVGRLTPALVAAAGFGDAEVLASRLLPAGPRQLSSDTIQVLLEVLAEVIARDPGALARNPYEDSPAARTTNSIAHETGAAACLGQPRGRLNAFINVLGQLRTMLWEGSPFDDQTPRNLWWSGARDLWSDAVREAYERASVADTRRAHIWREATLRLAHRSLCRRRSRHRLPHQGPGSRVGRRRLGRPYHHPGVGNRVDLDAD